MGNCQKDISIQSVVAHLKSQPLGLYGVSCLVQAHLPSATSPQFSLEPLKLVHVVGLVRPSFVRVIQAQSSSRWYTSVATWWVACLSKWVTTATLSVPAGTDAVWLVGHKVISVDFVQAIFKMSSGPWTCQPYRSLKGENPVEAWGTSLYAKGAICPSNGQCLCQTSAASP